MRHIGEDNKVAMLLFDEPRYGYQRFESFFLTLVAAQLLIQRRNTVRLSPHSKQLIANCYCSDQI